MTVGGEGDAGAHASTQSFGFFFFLPPRKKQQNTSTIKAFALEGKLLFVLLLCRAAGISADTK